MNWKHYKGYKDKRGNKIDFIDGKWQMYDDGGYYVRSDSAIPDGLLTIEAKKKADKEYKAYISCFNSDKKPPSLPKKTSAAKRKAKAYDEANKNNPETKATILRWRKELMKAGKLYSENEKKSFKAGLFTGLNKANKSKRG